MRLQLSDKALIESYYAAVELKLEEAFIKLLENELTRRGIVVSQPTEDKHES